MSETILGFNKSNVILAAGIAGAAFLGYCIYFDHKRINAPDYKEKIRQKRRAQAGTAGVAARRPAAAGNGEAVPDFNDAAQMQRFFLQEVQIGEELMNAGNVEEGAVHIANAIMLCGDSQQLLSIFQQTLSEEQFRAVVQQLPSTRERLADMFGQKADAAENEPPLVQYLGDGPPPAQIQELIDDTDDLE
uniref:Mitochondrial import receptor subunit TOM20 homolog n=1 Tax=Caenorhabditis japonica TaxID=281687 RepID=A0A8R1DSB1_CAEJA